jgi:hypothetical protein
VEALRQEIVAALVTWSPPMRSRSWESITESLDGGIEVATSAYSGVNEDGKSISTRKDGT